MSERSLLPAVVATLSCAVFVPAAPALAGSFDREVHLELGTDPHFERFDGTARLFVSRPEVVRAEQFRSGEVLLEPHAEGEAVVFLQSDHAVRAWRVIVGRPAPDDADAALARAKAACGDTSEDGERVVVPLRSETCRAAAVDLSRSLPPHRLEVHFDAEGLLAQLAAQKAAFMRAAPKADVQLAYLGATLRLKGRIARPDFDAAVRAMWAVTAGELLMDTSELEITDAVGPEPTNGDDAAKAEETGQDAAHEIQVIRGFDEAHPPQ